MRAMVAALVVLALSACPPVSALPDGGGQANDDDAGVVVVALPLEAELLPPEMLTADLLPPDDTLPKDLLNPTSRD